MITRSKRANLLFLAAGLLTIHAIPSIPASAENAQSVRLGEAALTYSAGSIRQQMPLDGVVNYITGDNQITGNRMVIGWTGTDQLYLRLKNPGDAALGDLYTVYRRTRKVFHPKTKEYLGYVVVKLAVVKVIQLDSSLIAAQVVRSFAPISPGDPIMRFVPPPAEESAGAVAEPAELEGMIVDLQSDKNMSLVGQWNVVYMDKGHDDGLQAGDRLEVFRTGNGLPRRKVGEVKVLSAEPRTSTGFLYRATSRVLVGDRVHYKDRSDMEAMPIQNIDAEANPLTAQPVTAKRSDLTTAGTDASQSSKIRLEHVDGITKISLEDLVDQLEYESGEVKVKPAAMSILEEIATYLRTAATDKQIRVEGHADNMEIGPSLKSSYPSNWELSKARAAGIVQYLVERGGMDSAKLSSVGYGASRPVASNATETGRKKNRRIEVILFVPEDEAKAHPVQDVKDSALPETQKFTFNQTGSAMADGTQPTSATAAPAGLAPSDVPSDHTATDQPDPVQAPADGAGAASPAQ
ncbi:MAG TPA: OmpA family protein [Nitrospiraceae bacterium]|nr:OmpA family protein [Nitrospiraceae bacterium]